MPLILKNILKLFLKKRETINWIPDLKDWRVINKELADLMVKQCEAALEGSIDSCDAATNRSDKLIAIFVPISSALAVYTIPKLISISRFYWVIKNDMTYLSCLLCLIASLYGLLQCLLNAKSYTISGVGSDPKKIISNKVVDLNFTNDQQYIALCLTICQNAALRIDKNNAEAYKRGLRNDKAVYTLISFPLIIIIVYLIHLIWH